MRHSLVFVLGVLLLSSALPLMPRAADAATQPLLSFVVQRDRVVDVMSLPQATPTLLDVVLPAHVVNPAAYAAAKSNPAPSAAPVVLSPPSSVSPRTITTGTSFQGLTATNCGCTPPDVELGVGPSNVVEDVNVDRKIWDKSGTAITTIVLATFYGTGANEMSDPKVLYDTLSSRWFSSMLDVTTNAVYVAVSSTNDPTGTWTVYHVTQASSFLPDQPILGVSSDEVVIGVNDFLGSTFQGGQYWVLSKSDMLASAATLHSAASTPTTSEVSPHPVRVLSSLTGEYMVMTGAAVTPGTPSTVLTLFTLTGVPPAAVSVSTTTITILSAVSPPNAPQPGTSNLIDTSDGRVQDAVWNKNILWLASDDSCVISSLSLSCIRLIQLNTGTTTKTQDFDVGAAGLFFFHGAMNVDGSGDLSVVYGFSNSATKPSLAITGQATTDALNTVEASTTIAAGTDVENGNQAGIGARYGDYFEAALDPSDTTKVWVAGEYENSGVSVSIGGYGTTHWATFIQMMSTQTSVASVTTNNLIGTDSSTNSAVTGALARLDIDGGPLLTYGMQAGDNTGTVAVLMRIVKISGGNGFTVGGMAANDQYESDFTIGTVDFALLFTASGVSAGTLAAYYKSSLVVLWNSGDTLTVGAISSGGTYTGTNIGFILVDSTAGTDGSVEFLISKSYLKTLVGGSGGIGNQLINIASSTFASGTGAPGSGGATPNDKSPSTGSATYTLTSGSIPEFPFGLLIVASASVMIFLWARKRRNSGSAMRPSTTFRAAVVQHD